LFYPSKELLLFDAINDMHDILQNQLVSKAAIFSERITCEELTDFLLEICIQVDHTGLLSIIQSGEIEYLMRSLPEDKVKEHQAHDNFNMEQLFQLLPIKNKKNIEAYSGAFRGVFLTMLHKREIGEQVFDEAIRLLIRGLVIQIMGDEEI
jgi:hypothetical protein